MRGTGRWLAWPASRSHRIGLQSFIGLMAGFLVTLLITVSVLHQVRSGLSRQTQASPGPAVTVDQGGGDPNAGLSNRPARSNPGAALGLLPVVTTAAPGPGPTDPSIAAAPTDRADPSFDATPSATATRTSGPTASAVTVPPSPPPTRPRTPPTTTTPTTSAPTTPVPTPTQRHPSPPSPTAPS